MILRLDRSMYIDKMHLIFYCESFSQYDGINTHVMVKMMVSPHIMRIARSTYMIVNL